MPIENCKISFFRLERCGYFKGNSITPEYGDISSILSQLSNWSQGKQLALTQTFDRVTKPNGDQELPVFLYDLKRTGNEWLLLIWNQVPATNSQVASVMANGTVGNAPIHMNPVQPGSIPGFATYFWFLPDRGVFANIRFQHAAGGHSALQTYFRGFLERCSDHVSFCPGGVGGLFDLEIEGYKMSSTDSTRSLHPRFRSSVYTKAGEHALLIENARKITKILRKTKLELQTSEDLALWQKMWRKIRSTQPLPQTDAVSVQYEMKASMTSEEVAEIIESQVNDVGTQSTWDDIGFQLAGDPIPKWLSKSYARDDFELEFERTNAEIVNLESLQSALNRRRDAIIALLS